MPQFSLTRRSLLAASTLLLASTAMPRVLMAQEAKSGGRLVVAADSEPKNLNPAIVASNGVTGKVFIGTRKAFSEKYYKRY